MTMDPDLFLSRADVDMELAQFFLHGGDPIALFDAQTSGVADVGLPFGHRSQNEYDRSQVRTVVEIDGTAVQRSLLNAETVTERPAGRAEVFQDR